MAGGNTAVTLFDDQLALLRGSGISQPLRRLVDAHLYPDGVPIQTRIQRAQTRRKADKMQLVKDMLYEGYCINQAPALLGISERTVERYMRMK